MSIRCLIPANRISLLIKEDGGLNAKRLTHNALLLGIALIIFMLEAQLPSLTPISGIKMGLSNIITVWAMFVLGPVDAAMILLGRIVLGAVFSGNMSVILYSGAGGLLSFFAMMLLRTVLTERQIFAASAIAAVFHNLGQILVAVMITHSEALWAYFPILCVSGIIAGTFTGLCAQFMILHMRKQKAEKTTAGHDKKNADGS